MILTQRLSLHTFSLEETNLKIGYKVDYNEAGYLCCYLCIIESINDDFLYVKIINERLSNRIFLIK